MAKKGGFQGGMPGSQANMMKQIQRMQRQIEEKQKEFAEKTFEATAGGGAVKATVSGEGKLLSIKLQEEVVDPEDVEMLEDLVVAAVNEAMRAQEEEYAKVMAPSMGGGIGGLGF